MRFEVPKTPALTDTWHAAAAPETPAQAPAAEAPVAGTGSGILGAAGELFAGLFDGETPASVVAAGVGGVGGGGSKILPPGAPQQGGKQQQQQRQPKPQPAPDPQPEPKPKPKPKPEDSFQTPEEIAKEKEERIKRLGGRPTENKDRKGENKDKKKEGLFPDGLFGSPPDEEVAKGRMDSGMITLLLLGTLLAPEITIPAAAAALLLGPSTAGPASGLGPATAPPMT